MREKIAISFFLYGDKPGYDPSAVLPLDRDGVQHKSPAAFAAGETSVLWDVCERKANTCPAHIGVAGISV